MSEPSKELNAEVKATECIDSSVKDKAEPSSRVEVNREALSGYDELVTEEDIYALERSRRGPRRPSWKLLNPPRKKSGEQANPIVGQRKGSPSRRRSSPDYADLLPSDNEDSDDDGHRRRRGRSRELTTADIGNRDHDSPRLRARVSSREGDQRLRSTSGEKREQFYRRGEHRPYRSFMSGRFEDHYKKYTTVEDRKRVQNNRVAGISDFLAWAKDAKEVDVDTATGRDRGKKSSKSLTKSPRKKSPRSRRRSRSRSSHHDDRIERREGHRGVVFGRRR